MAKKLIFLFFAFFLFSSSKFTYAQENSFVTIVNPQRVSEYTKDYLSSFRTQLFEIEKRNLPATWLVTFDVLAKKDFVNALKKLEKSQELGIFLEITPNLTNNARVPYKKFDSWHRAGSLFTVGYSQTNRIKLIDTVFKKFKKEFGYYPTSVGAWYIDAFSLNYMQRKYGIAASLNMSDQYNLDGYQLWGTPWSVPYYPSKINASTPGDLPVLMLRWASRDPLNGYQKTTEYEPSLFSLQDYNFIGLSSSYFENLLKTFALQNKHNSFGHATVGLEGDLAPETYQTFFSKNLDIVLKLKNQGLIKIATMQDFAKWYKENTSQNSIHIIESNDLTLKTNKKAYWIQSPFYRIALTYNPSTKIAEIIDLRTYPINLEEPFLKSLNKQHNLSINLPFVIDAVIQPENIWRLELGSMKSIENNTLIFEKGNIEFKENEIIFPNNTTIPDFLKASSYITVLKNRIIANSEFQTKQDGTTFMDFSLDLPFAIKRTFPAFLADKFPKLYFPIPQIYTISQTEMDALKVLKDLPNGKVLVYDWDCLNCSYSSKYKPASMAGKKAYVKKYSNKNILEDLTFSTAKTSQESKKELKKKNIRYVYLSKYEDYIESLPYLPQDLGLSKVYENANAEIWITSP